MVPNPMNDASRVQTIPDPQPSGEVTLPFGARLRIDDGTLAEPFCYLSRRQAAWCAGAALGALVAHLPCWVPQRLVSVAEFGDAGAGAVDAVTAVYGPWAWATEFSNVHTTFAFDEPGFVLGGVRHANVEAYFQGAKSVGLPGHDDAMRLLAASVSPTEAFRIGRTHGLRLDWEAVKVEVMREGVRAKFTQDEGLRALLLSTGSVPLVQLKPGDACWGTGAEGRGHNTLGVLLMALREALRRGE